MLELPGPSALRAPAAFVALLLAGACRDEGFDAHARFLDAAGSLAVTRATTGDDRRAIAP